MKNKIFIFSLFIINAYSPHFPLQSLKVLSNDRISNYHKERIKKFLLFDNEYENRVDDRTSHRINNRTDKRIHPTPHNRTEPYPKPDNRTDNRTEPYPKPDNKTDNRTDPYPKPDNKTDNRTDPHPKPDNKTDNKSNIELVSVNTNAVEYSMIAEDFLLIFKNEDTNQNLIHSVTIKKFSNGAIFRLPLYCYKKENNYFVSCLGDVKNFESDIYFVTGIEYGIEFINLNRPLIFYIQKNDENQKGKHSC